MVKINAAVLHLINRGGYRVRNIGLFLQYLGDSFPAGRAHGHHLKGHLHIGSVVIRVTRPAVLNLSMLEKEKGWMFSRTILGCIIVSERGASWCETGASCETSLCSEGKQSLA